MRNKLHIQRELVALEAITKSFIQFIRNTPLTEKERHFLEQQMSKSDRAFNQVRMYLEQEEDTWRG